MNDIVNGWSVSTQNDPIIVTRNSDGKQFIVDSTEGHDRQISQMVLNDVLSIKDKELEEDLK